MPIWIEKFDFIQPKLGSYYEPNCIVEVFTYFVLFHFLSNTIYFQKSSYHFIFFLSLFVACMPH